MKNGWYIWKIESLPPPDRLVDLCYKYNIDSLLVKLVDGLTYKNRPGGNDKYLRETWLNTLWQAGIEVGGWGFPYPQPTLSPGAQGDLWLERWEKLQWDGKKLFAIHHDIEQVSSVGAFWKTSPDRYRSAGIYIDKIYSLRNKVEAGLASYRFPSWHLDLPWKQLANRDSINTYVPQVYPIGAHNFDVQLRQTFEEYHNLSYANPSVHVDDGNLWFKRKNFQPIGPAFGAYYKASDGSTKWWEPTADDLAAFVKEAKNIENEYSVIDIPRIWWWSLDYVIAKERYDWLEVIQHEIHGVTPPPPPPPPDPEPDPGDIDYEFRVQVVTPAGLNVRQGSTSQSAKIGALPYGTDIPVKAVTEGENGDWYELTGRISGDPRYTRKV